MRPKAEQAIDSQDMRARGIIEIPTSWSKISRQNYFSQLKLDFNPCLPPKSWRFSLLVGYNIQFSSSSTNQNAAMIIDHQLDFTNTKQFAYVCFRAVFTCWGSLAVVYFTRLLAAFLHTEYIHTLTTDTKEPSNHLTIKFIKNLHTNRAIEPKLPLAHTLLVAIKASNGIFHEHSALHLRIYISLYSMIMTLMGDKFKSKIYCMRFQSYDMYSSCCH